MSNKFKHKLLGIMFEEISNLPWYKTFVWWVFDSKFHKSKELRKTLSDELESTTQIDTTYKLAMKLKKPNPYQTIYSNIKWTRFNIEYLSDWKGYGRAEYWADAWETISNKFGDCDDQAKLVYVLCRLAGIPADYLWICLGDTNLDEDSKIDHYYCIFWDARRDRWVSLDTTVDPEIKQIYLKKEWKVGKRYTLPEYIFNENNVYRFKK